MNKINQPKYLQTTFDKAFITSVDYLTTNRTRILTPFRFQKDLLAELNINASNFSEMKNGKRGVPKYMQADIYKVLTVKYQVNPSFLQTNKGDILKYKLEPIPLGDDSGTNNTELDEAKKEIEYLKQLIAEKQKIIDLLDHTLELYKKQYES